MHASLRPFRRVVCLCCSLSISAAAGLSRSSPLTDTSDLNPQNACSNSPAAHGQRMPTSAVFMFKHAAARCMTKSSGFRVRV